MLSLKAFPHRHNLDGSYDSICTRCFATVATVRKEEDLRGHEAIHRCKFANLCRIKRWSIIEGSLEKSKQQSRAGLFASNEAS
jgi:hypothetical protein